MAQNYDYSTSGVWRCCASMSDVELQVALLADAILRYLEAAKPAPKPNKAEPPTRSELETAVDHDITTSKLTKLRSKLTSETLN